MKIVALDLGGTTGLAFYDTVEEHWTTAQFGPELHYDRLWNALNVFHPVVLVCESFQVGGDLRSSESVQPLRYEGLVHLWAARNRRCDLVWQTAPQGKQFWDDEKLKAVKLYQPDRPHANDATRHLLFYMTFVRRDNRWINLLRESLPQEHFAVQTPQ